ncbi:MAG: TonB-dependent receptor [Novosphingobium sp.]|nr:MAG: TonB-dependent receptor [Novosphingobium sp.]
MFIGRFALLAGAASGAILAAAPAYAQSASAEASGTDIVVTARRTEERLQDVPISITVYNAEQISNRNIAVASDLATYTPSLSVNARYGAEKAAFSLRGFNQDQSTAPTVGVYFADVVGVRAQGGTTSGNTVGAGSFTDLQNVQVLKGPQGTLFGRNTTGGAVLLVPQKPTDRLEGYVEGTYGNFDQKRVQAALNIPLADTFKVRLSLDRNKRDGYMNNKSGIGPDNYNDTDYVYGRLSIVADLTPDLENYFIGTYSRSDTNGYATRYTACDRNFVPSATTFIRYLTAQAGCAQIDRQAARGDSLFDVDVNNANPRILLEQWQVINTTTWRASDTLTVKNIMSYGEFREDAAFSLYSDNFRFPDTPITRAQFPQLIGNPFQYIRLATQPGFHASAESTATEELQIQGNSADGKFNFVLGGYLEFSRPLGFNQQRTGIYGNCVDPGTLNCAGGLPLVPLSATFTAPGAVISESRTKLAFDNHGIFAQATYKFTDQLALTGGFRYTFDKIVGYSESNRYTFATIPGAGTIPVARSCNDNFNHPTVNLLTNGGNTAACGTTIVNKSSKPTWLIDLDFKPTPDTLFYAKWARGYRQGGVNFTNPGLETWNPEKVDSYELGAKLTFRGTVNGYFNVAGFYNDFSNQQIFGGLVAKQGSGIAGGAAIINAGKSTIKGAEVDAGVTLFDALNLTLGYTYLDTKIKELVPPVLAPQSPFERVLPRGAVGSPLTYSPKHRLTLAAEYNLPLNDDLGRLSIGANYVYTSSQLVDGNLSIAATNIVNANLGWKNIAGSNIDLTGFVTNLTNKTYFSTAGGGFDSLGVYDWLLAPPRMYGVRLRVNFGR